MVSEYKGVRAPIYNFGPKDIPTIPRFEPEKAADGVDWGAVKKRIAESTPVDWDKLGLDISPGAINEVPVGMTVQEFGDIIKEYEMTVDQFSCSAADLYAIRRNRNASDRVLENLKSLEKNDVIKFTADGNGNVVLTEINRAPFDWSTAKPGMAFLVDGLEYGEIVHYVGPALGNSEKVVTASGKDTTLKYTVKCALTRYPKKDIK